MMTSRNMPFNETSIHNTRPNEPLSPKPPTKRESQKAILASPFRPFFLLAALYAIVSITGWIAYLFFGLHIPTAWQITQWHTHEMIFGFVSAAIAGFLLTAMSNWTGAPPLKGTPLFLLVMLWVVGRIAMWSSNLLPQYVGAGLDTLFLLCLTLYVFSVLIRYKNKRNLVMGAILTVLTISNLMMHFGSLTTQYTWVKSGENLGLNIIMLLMIVLGGRVIPFFTRSWLTRIGQPADHVKVNTLIDILSIGSVVTFIIAQQFIASAYVIFSIAICAFILNTIRLIGWAGWRCTKEPLLWILHIAYLWVAIALLLRGLSAINIVGNSVWIHALGLGGMGTMILGIMTRVSLGHTGRPLTLPAYANWIYILITIASIIRVLTALNWMDYPFGIMLTAISWSLAFGLFFYVYFSILTAPRADGKPG